MKISAWVVFTLVFAVMLMPVFCWADANDDLRSAAIRNDLQMAKDAIVAGANLNSKDIVGNTPLVYAAGDGLTEMVKFLIEKGADVNLTGDGGYTPLMFAAGSGSAGSGPIEVVKVLLEKGADINAQAGNGATVLESAQDNPEMVVFLKQAGAK